MTGTEYLAETTDEKEFFDGQKEITEANVDPAPSPSNEAAKINTPTPEPAAPDGERQRFVPHEALHEERTKRQELQSKVQEMEARFKTMVERIQQRDTPPPAPEAPPVPNPETDPIEYIKYLGQQQERQQAEQQRQQAEQQRFQAFQTKLGEAESAFRADTPDYDAAVQFALEARHKELELFGVTSPQERGAIIQQEIWQHANRHFETGANPAKSFYEYAKLRGYGAAPPTPPTPAPQEKVASLAAKQAVARSPALASSAPTDPVSLESLSGMNDDEFDRYFEQLWKKT